MTPLFVNPRVLRIAGPVPAVVYAVLSANDTGDGAELAYSQIADAANISISSARRAVATLRQEGLLVSEPTVEELYGQQANRYRLLETAQPPVQDEQACTWIDTNSYIETCISTSINYQSNTGMQGNRECEAQGSQIPWPTSWEWVRAWTPINSPRPMPANNNFLKSCQERLWLVSYMEGYVLERQNAERRRKGWKLIDGLPDKRRLQFLRDAEKLLGENSLPRVVDVIDWVFINHGGWLPFDIIDSCGMTRKDTERKVTSLRKIWENYEMILGTRSIEPV